MLLLLTGCLLLAEQPPLPGCEDDCGAYACDYGYLGADPVCLTECIVDDDCADGFVCPGGERECTEPCEDDSCDDGFVCDTYTNECDDYCLDDDECQPGWTCCDFDAWQDDDCPDMGACVR